MKANARVYKAAKNSLGIVIPSAITKMLNIVPGNRIEVDIQNPHPDYVEEPDAGKRFAKK